MNPTATYFPRTKITNLPENALAEFGMTRELYEAMFEAWHASAGRPTHPAAPRTMAQVARMGRREARAYARSVYNATYAIIARKGEGRMAFLFAQPAYVVALDNGRRRRNHRVTEQAHWGA